jgi:molecular chaperone HtpG
MAETFKFEAEINNLLGMIVQSFYSDKDIFLRELISNSSDALEKLRRRSLSDNLENVEYFIRISFDKENKILTIEDTGIGMTRDELKNNLGTIAKSGTAELIKQLKENKEQSNSLIGSFGVGFYSLYLVGDSATVISKSIDSDRPYKWTSTLNGEFAISELEEGENFGMERGTRIMISVKDSEIKYLEESVLKKIIQTHSSYIRDPIQLYSRKTRKVKDEDNKDVDEEYFEYVAINDQGPIWEKSPSTVTDEEYKAFYKTLDSGEYLDKIHFKLEGDVEFSGLFFIPKPNPFAAFLGQSKSKDSNVKLYKNRVLITKDCKDLIPEYFSEMFKGVIDCNQISLSVSREIPQKSHILKLIKKHTIKKIIRHLQTLYNADIAKYNTIYNAYRKEIKFGIHDDKENRDELATLLQFNTLNTQDTFTTLNKYIETKKEEQNEIFYIVGENIKELSTSPFITHYKNRGIDVILCVDKIDAYCINSLGKFKGLEFVDITKLKTDKDKQVSDEDKAVCKYFKDILGNRIEDVVISTKEFEQAALISATGINSVMDKIVKAQAMANDETKKFMKCTKVLELNGSHPLIKYIVENRSVEGNENHVEILFSSACLTSGFDVSNPVNLGKRLERMICKELGLHDLEYNKTELVENEEENDLFGGAPDLEEPTHACSDANCTDGSCQTEDCQDGECQDEDCQDVNCVDESCQDENCQDANCADESCQTEDCQDEICDNNSNVVIDSDSPSDSDAVTDSDTPSDSVTTDSDDIDTEVN